MRASAFPGHPHRNRDARSGAGDGLTGVPPPAAVPPAGVVPPPEEEPPAGVVLPDDGVVPPPEEEPPPAGVVPPPAGVVPPPAGVVLPDEEPPPPEAPTCAVELLPPIGGLFFDEGPAGDVPCADVGRPAVGWPAWAAVAGAGPRLEPGPVLPAPAARACAAALEFAWPPGCEDDAVPGPVPVAGCAPALSITATIAATPHSATPTPAAASRRGPGRAPPGRPAVAGAPPAPAVPPASAAQAAASAAVTAPAAPAACPVPSGGATIVGESPEGAAIVGE